VKLSRPVASAIGVAIVAASALAIAAPANAATPGVTYITAAQIVDGPPSAAGGWGLLNGDTPSSSNFGLVATGFPDLAYSFPTPIPLTGGALQNLGAATSFAVSDYADAYAYIYWVDSNDVGHILGAGGPGNAFQDPTSDWSSDALVDGTNYATLADFDIAIAADPAFVDSAIVGVSLYISSSDGANVYAVTVNGADFSFMPTPVPVAPTTLTQPAYAATGITITTTGFLPGEEVEVYQSFPTAAGPDGGNAPGVTADANGAITYTFRPAAGVTPLVGAYNLTFVGTAGAQLFDYSITAAAAALAATGTDSFAPLAAGGVLLLGGAALAIVAIKRRRTV